jgi:hypothetical protein
MKRTKKVQFNVLKQDVTVELQPKRRGVYWNYSDVPFNYGPFKSDDQAINDAKLYSQYGTTNKTLLTTRGRARR